ncbi:energy-coupling factor transporter ATPase [Halanaerobacter jeridensis]|uniref:Energy-coupling factor transporter ATP-binding protein EcfA2 n=1 Tax=Halanaerobacter jeridensis TaxID=706427 RepID=A0A938XTV4_9FIRM|nr:energy-coupling factor transporter ATPase [Halanaerobacter jeridensis]MBM7557804.1 energy-coupling factor transport system ATP-binding protein [Halanaerobacter jeridensis]
MLIEVNDLEHCYSPDLDPGDYAIKDISFEIAEGEFIGLIGHTGSGKSTLVQTLNGLVEPTGGQVKVSGLDLTEAESLKEIHQKVGLVFQYPEHQLFEETVFKDVAFGPKNLGLKEGKIKKRVQHALELVNLDYDQFKDRSPFRLSGGQQRRVAIAGVLAMEPEILILDEPTAGLDPQMRKQLIEEIVELQEKFSLTIILISHRMEEIARLSDRVFVLDNGKLSLTGTPDEVFSNYEYLTEIGLGVPEITEVLHKVRARGIEVDTNIFTVDQAKNELLKVMRG